MVNSLNGELITTYSEEMGYTVNCMSYRRLYNFQYRVHFEKSDQLDPERSRRMQALDNKDTSTSLSVRFSVKLPFRRRLNIRFTIYDLRLDESTNFCEINTSH